MLLQDMAKLVVSVWSLVTTTEIVRTKRLNWPATIWRFPQSFHQPSSSSSVVLSWTRSILRDPISSSCRAKDHIMLLWHDTYTNSIKDNILLSFLCICFPAIY
ncbi:Insulin-degrading enzyme [Temnothorax longispinosus]|uniref:Insulin-degrading enzyme n=1 Tax=Temnothorax longispinosus TaxID=300112 RepID=A0A4S2KN28_9HYME|nr:Insulin-degrading enzyme [Temnothorax longispinosus]